MQAIEAPQIYQAFRNFCETDVNESKSMKIIVKYD